MPIYEFRCTSCLNAKEYFQKVSDPAPSHCEACGKDGELEKVVSQTSFQLKGGGWYNDLYSSNSSKTTKSESKDSSKAPEKPAAAKKDTAD